MWGLQNPEMSQQALPRGPHRLQEATLHTPVSTCPWQQPSLTRSPALGTPWESELEVGPQPFGTP